MKVFNPWEIPLLNTEILLLSGATVTCVHYGITLKKLKNEITIFYVITIFLACLFTFLQLYEYSIASFSISDGIYGSTFYMATGFHGVHVLIGTVFLSVQLFRFLRNDFTKKHHLGFEFAVWYWHFVDVVWLFLFVSMYWWGGA
jgi:heme/copper-type cytochrome/quinol oxidase subunit 3